MLFPASLCFCLQVTAQEQGRQQGRAPTPLYSLPLRCSTLRHVLLAKYLGQSRWSKVSH